jgi:hypothetical protein
MYRVIAYQGKGKETDVNNDLRLLWDSLRCFLSSQSIQHIYCFQSVEDKKGASLFLVVKYGVSEDKSSYEDLSSDASIDYWFYRRGGNKKRERAR